jgi:hypothetical protein
MKTLWLLLALCPVVLADVTAVSHYRSNGHIQIVIDFQPGPFVEPNEPPTPNNAQMIAAAADLREFSQCWLQGCTMRDWIDLAYLYSPEEWPQ